MNLKYNIRMKISFLHYNKKRYFYIKRKEVVGQTKKGLEYKVLFEVKKLRARWSVELIRI